MKEIFALCMIVTIVSFLGFAVENIWLALTKGYMDNRNMYFPFLLGDGLAVMIFYYLFGTPDNLHILGMSVNIDNSLVSSLIYLGLVSICISMGEILLGTAVEKMCGIVWWNYTWIPLHITKYTCVPVSMGFATLIVLFMNLFFEPLMMYFKGIDMEILAAVSIIAMLLMVVDFIHSGIYMYKKREFVRVWRLDMVKLGNVKGCLRRREENDKDFNCG